MKSKEKKQLTNAYVHHFCTKRNSISPLFTLTEKARENSKKEKTFSLYSEIISHIFYYYAIPIISYEKYKKVSHISCLSRKIHITGMIWIFLYFSYLFYFFDWVAETAFMIVRFPLSVIIGSICHPATIIPSVLPIGIFEGIPETHWTLVPINASFLAIMYVSVSNGPFGVTRL